MEGDSSLLEFRPVLSNLLSVDNELRTNAESMYESIPANKKVILLLSAIRNNIPIEEAELAAVLLRKSLYTEFEEVYSALPVDHQNQIKGQVLLLVQQDMNFNLKKKVCDVAAGLARNLLDDDGNNHWPEFLKFLFECASSTNLELRVASLLMFSSVPGVFGNQQLRYLDIINQMLTQSLANTESLEVCHAAVKATTAFILAHEKEVNVLRHFSECLTLLLKLLATSFENPQIDAEDILRQLVDLVETCPQFFRGQLDSLLQLCLKGLSHEATDESCRHLCLEVVVSLCETAPAMVRKLGSKHIASLVPIIFTMMTDLDDDPNWNFQDEESSDEDDSNPIVGEAALDRIACALGGKTVLPLVVNSLPHMLNSGEWKQRYAGLMTISAAGEGCHTQMALILPQIVEGVIPFLNDPHPRVKYAACNAVGQMATDFAPVFQKKFHEKVIPGLLQLLGDPSNSRVQAHSGAALVNFFESCPKNTLTIYLNSIVEKLEYVLNSKFKELVEKGTKLVLEQVVVTLASLADNIEEKFIGYYEKFMPSLKYIIMNANAPELRVLRGKTIECVSLIGLAVGKEKFIADASEVMDLLLKTQTADSPIMEDDPQLSYMIAAWARICKILGKAFEPYLPFVMEPVLKAASLKPEIAVLDSDDMKVVENDDDWQFVNLGEKHNFGIRTAGLDEKATACQMLVCYARELKEGFAAYVEETVKLMVPMLKFYFHDDVREAAAEILPYLIESAKVRGDVYVQEMWRYICPQLLQAIDTEPENEVLCELFSSFAQCVEVLGTNCMTHEDTVLLVNNINKSLEAHFERARERQEKRKEEDYDEVLEEVLISEDDGDVYILSRISEVIGALFSIFKTSFLSYFDMMVKHFVYLLDPGRSPTDHEVALNVFADLIQHTGPACRVYENYFMLPMVSSLSSNLPELRQTGAYLVGILAQHGGEEFAKICSETIPLLINMINAAESRSEENVRATENSISAVTKILACNNSQVSTNDLIPVWMTWLPVWDDEEETIYINNFLCTLLEQNNPFLLGNENCNLPRILMIIAETFHREAIDVASDVGKRMITLVKHVQANEELFSICVSQLTVQQQEALHTALTATPSVTPVSC